MQWLIIVISKNRTIIRNLYMYIYPSIKINRGKTWNIISEKIPRDKSETATDLY